VHRSSVSVQAAVGALHVSMRACMCSLSASHEYSGVSKYRPLVLPMAMVKACTAHVAQQGFYVAADLQIISLVCAKHCFTRTDAALCLQGEQHCSSNTPLCIVRHQPPGRCKALGNTQLLPLLVGEQHCSSSIPLKSLHHQPPGQCKECKEAEHAHGM
jgi:hypothetical protein